jgi:hypothetical protein
MPAGSESCALKASSAARSLLLPFRLLGWPEREEAAATTVVEVEMISNNNMDMQTGKLSDAMFGVQYSVVHWQQAMGVF